MFISTFEDEKASKIASVCLEGDPERNDHVDITDLDITADNWALQVPKFSRASFLPNQHVFPS